MAGLGAQNIFLRAEMGWWEPPVWTGGRHDAK